MAKAHSLHNDLEYDLNTKVGIYRNGGKVVNKKSVLTSWKDFIMRI